ncbi:MULTISPECIES: orotidine 5'-phosphate decarboxylase / HUMPS family protein [Pseudonocardia]|uniref:Orotidine 5'-phosphate decarboxylase / HUMPS family protein n=2 Tax=Pseudonocardia TaxID=1847 RepID=A0A1Y2MR72_PSEAH|nr:MULTISPECIES: orotidine 5'-phosphate decarboxylase / HUMPS family protein [Pseudonocardia]OSY37735.1 Orotidine 5'-phosphate decarboxylase / HUMPS family protein [Pseudonocardia autotrophica]TDN75775.1 orotidine-5'-phosphate decarboxylase [Pseudonocardia autotrophica]BBF99746.1 orotidine 5'-phosphate decarboxylase [Pseudonocardia autotrophica]GEC27112.1 orotidine 5'-phosphate decarboxylase [Pseudonocardia saturnea]
MPDRPTSGIVPALDVPDIDTARRLAEATATVPGVLGFKIGLQPVLASGLAHTVRALREVTDLPLYYDHQKAGLDIPSNGPGLAATVAAAGVDGLIVFPVAGPSAVQGFVRSALDHRVRPIVGAALPLADYTVSGGGWIADDVLARVTELAVQHGARDLVVPAHDLGRAAAVTAALVERHDGLTFFVPGVGGDATPVLDALRAVRGPRAIAIVGRAVHAAPDPLEAARRLAGDAAERATRT